MTKTEWDRQLLELECKLANNMLHQNMEMLKLTLRAMDVIESIHRCSRKLDEE